jgi:H2-forming N5,N10-methylenetetrahydromethanopterin dehydrogenase-like enzyme
VTTAAPSTQLTDQDRLAAITARVEALRAQTRELLQRASEVSTHVQEARSAPRQACNHAEQVKTMQAALDAVEHEIDGLRTAMLTRGVIEQAKGMLMLERQVDSDAAFAMLVQLSQTSHRKLVDVATALVSSWSAGDRAHA